MRGLVIGMVGVAAVLAGTSASAWIVMNGVELQGVSMQGVSMQGRGAQSGSQQAMPTGVRVQGVKVVGGQLFLQPAEPGEVTGD
jgi:hypothetical protein